MDEIKKEFISHFENENKEKAVSFILTKLKNNEIDVVDLYTEILIPALNDIKCYLKDKRMCVWQEHVKTGIVRTIVENCYTYVIAKRDKMNIPKKGIATILCPPDEYHDLGARIATDYFTIAGYDSIFVGGNTPYQDFYHAIEVIKPTIVAINVSNSYHLVATKKMIAELRRKLSYGTQIVVGGNAFRNDGENILKMVGGDSIVISYDDIIKLSGSEV